MTSLTTVQAGEQRTPTDLRDRFLSRVLPAVERHARIYFRHLRSADQDDAVQETIAIAWKWFVHLTERGKDAARFPAALARYAARAVNSGRRLCGQENA
jgi:hypothetical protein